MSTYQEKKKKAREKAIEWQERFCRAIHKLRGACHRAVRL